MVNKLVIILIIIGSFFSKPVFAATRTSPLIIDHTTSNLFNQIPDSYITYIQNNFAIHFAHTSHGGQIISGMYALREENSKYNLTVMEAVPNHNPTELNQSYYQGVLKIYSGQPPGQNGGGYVSYITPDLYWETSGGIGQTQAAVNSGIFDYSLWTWCGQASDYSSTQINQYLNQMKSFDNQYSNTGFILFTGHTDGSTAGSNSLLWQNNNLIRQFARNNNKILFDFADMESYDPSGTYYPNASDACDWCQNWYDQYDGGILPNSCDHAHPLQCKLKAKAFWVMMAKLAGWNSTSAPINISNYRSAIAAFQNIFAINTIIADYGH